MILHRYFAQRFIFGLGGVIGVFGLLMAFVELVERLRTLRNVDVSFGQVVQLALLNLPDSLYRIIPLLVIIATIWLFLGLARSSELVVTRAAGRSALRALVAPCLVAFTFGLVTIGIFNPIVASTSREFDARLSTLTGEGSSFTVSSDGLWLRQGSTNGQTVIRADATNLDGTELSGVTFITFTLDGGPVRRIEATSARLIPGQWDITNAKVWPLADAENPEAVAEYHETFQIPSSLTVDQIRDSFGSPTSVPIWELPAFIEKLRTAGFSARRHAVWLQSELAMPLFLVAMVLIGAAFTMRPQRGGKTGQMVLWAILISFGLYFVRNFASILGENGQIPIALAAWAPPFVAVGFAFGLLLHLEDG